MQIRVNASLLLALGLVSGVVWLFASPADARLVPTPQSSSSGIAAPRSMVVFDSLDSPAFPGFISIPVPAGGSVTVATVPTNRWLVITDFDVQGNGSTDLVEDLAGVITVKRQNMPVSPGRDSFHSSVGLSFAPGSQVMIRNRNSNNVSVNYHLGSYWAAP
ncbi:MAG: hypothetical protein NTV21_13665 [Planctomycetota bacterium]|nr:hypothetical protein [Planctomycetota bacterium]